METPVHGNTASLSPIKTRFTAAASGTILTCKNWKATPPGIEPGSLSCHISRCPHSSGVGWPTCSWRVAGSRPGASDTADFQHWESKLPHIILPTRKTLEALDSYSSRVGGRGGLVVRSLASHLDEPLLISAEVLPDFRMHVSYRTMPLVGGFSRDLLFTPPWYSDVASPLLALKTSILRNIQISPLLSCVEHFHKNTSHATCALPITEQPLVYYGITEQPLVYYGVTEQPLVYYGITEQPLVYYGITEQPLVYYGITEQPLVYYGITEQPLVYYGITEQPLVYYGITEQPLVYYGITEQPLVYYGITERPLVYCGITEQPLVYYGITEQPLVYYGITEQPLVYYGITEQPLVYYGIIEQPLVYYGITEQPLVCNGTGGSRNDSVVFIAQLMEWLQEEWRRIPVDVLQTLIESMPDRVAAVIAARAKESMLNESRKGQEERGKILKELVTNRVRDRSPHPIHTFFERMAQTVKKFSLRLIAETRLKVSQIVSEMEIHSLMEQESQMNRDSFQQPYQPMDGGSTVPLPSSSSKAIAASMLRNTLTFRALWKNRSTPVSAFDAVTHNSSRVRGPRKTLLCSCAFKVKKRGTLTRTPSASSLLRARRAVFPSLLASHQGDSGSIPGRVTPDLRKWESCRTIPLVGGFSRGSPVSPAPSFRRHSVLTSITLIGSQDLDVKSRPNLFSHPLTLWNICFTFAAVGVFILVGYRRNCENSHSREQKLVCESPGEDLPSSTSLFFKHNNEDVKIFVFDGAAVAQWLECPPPTKANRVFSEISPAASHSGAAPCSPLFITLIGSQDLNDERCPIITTLLLYKRPREFVYGCECSALIDSSEQRVLRQHLTSTRFFATCVMEWGNDVHASHVWPSHLDQSIALSTALCNISVLVYNCAYAIRLLVRSVVHLLVVVAGRRPIADERIMDEMWMERWRNEDEGVNASVRRKTTTPAVNEQISDSRVYIHRTVDLGSS
ncbi:hypothetical protein PR048_027391 [Dryococelus australis]|uniref:Uncharacterized protein n=1 Tax=Dryococelus australis TaxID=614101 RepID=A0ABQ9GFC2_9NEOP|nr:hypothetical protein PR048_027391 [Dryococelus australis]